jgi:hypothetical protein
VTDLVIATQTELLEVPEIQQEVLDATADPVLVEVALQGPPGALGPQGPAGPQGAQGQQGPQGPAGSGDLSYTHNQGVASDTWVIDHPLGKHPSVTVTDSAGSECEGEVLHLSTSQVIVSFSAAFSGRAFLN